MTTRCRLLLGAALATGQLALLATAPPAALASSISVVYDAGGIGAVDPCSEENYFGSSGALVSGPLRACAGGIDRTPQLVSVVEAAAAHWQDILEDPQSVEIRFWWAGPFASPDASVLERHPVTGRPIKSRIRIPSNTAYFYDPTPQLDSEFAMRPKLFRTTHPLKQAEAFDGSPPATLEVAYNGRQSVGGSDLLTIVLHEMGHALGLAGATGVTGSLGPDPDAPACHEGVDPFYRPSPAALGGAQMGIKAYEKDGTLDCNHLAVGGIAECKNDPEENPLSDAASPLAGFTVAECTSHQALMWTGLYPGSRARPSITDILAVGLGGGWSQLNLPRKYSLGSGAWHDAATWLGHRAPDAADDVYVANQDPAPTIVNSHADAAARAALVSDENTLRVVNSTLDVATSVTAAGVHTAIGPLRPAPPSPPPGDPGSEIDGSGPLTRLEVEGSDGRIEAARVAVERGAAMQLKGGSADAGQLDSEGVIVGAGDIQTSSLDNHGRIRAFDGTLTIATPSLPPDTEVSEPVQLDLDGSSTSSTSSIVAMDGDLVFDGKIADPVRAPISVGEGRTVSFTQGWTQQFSGDAHRLLLDGGDGEAVVVGDTTIGGRVRINGRGRLADDATLEPTARVQLDIAGTTPGSEHDQLNVGGVAELDGHLDIALGGHQPAPLDEFVVLTYASHAGEFSSISGIELGGGLELMPVYANTQLILRSGFQGAAPGEPGCEGKVTKHQTQLHGGLKSAANFHGYEGPVNVSQLREAIEQYCNG